MERNIRLSLPSKGRMGEATMEFLQECGMRINKPNPRQYQATIREIPGLTVLFQRPADIVTSVKNGSVDFGISGLDIIEEARTDSNEILVLHDGLGFGSCALRLAVPEEWEEVQDVAQLRARTAALGTPVRIATKFPNLTARFMRGAEIPFQLVSAEGTLETAPEIGYADMISDLVSSGQTLRDNRLRALSDGEILRSQAALIGNLQTLRQNPEARRIARFLLEFFEANLRGKENLSIFANMRGASPEEIAKKLFANDTISGLQGPTISRVLVESGNQAGWYAVNVVVRRDELFEAVGALRAVGGSGVVVLPVRYIFEEEPPRYTAMLKAIGGKDEEA
ncbi:MAG: ATP phosphoribosyltransferase [Anaerolineaceae bacterium]|nr:ATP phosphoribosyltransferase [Anaerolineaceae bacterium]